MKLAVLGTTGLIGQHAARAALARGHALVVIHRAGSQLDTLAGLAFEARQADLDDRAALERALAGVDAVIHCAGYYPRQVDRTDDELAVACRQMDNFCAAALAAGVGKVVFVSAASVLNKPAGVPLADETMRFPRAPGRDNPFRLIKWHLERIADEAIGRGLPLVFAIPSMVFGPHDHGPTAGRLIVGIANGTLRHIVDCPRNVIAGADVGEGLMRCLEAGRVGDRYLLAGHNIALADLAARIAALAGVPAPRRVPLAAARALAAWQTLRWRLTGRQPSVKRSELAMLAAGKYLDAGKAQRELGFRANTSLDDAIAAALAWFKNNGTIATR